MTMICPICSHSTKHDANAEVVKCIVCGRSFQLEPMNTESQQQIAVEAAKEIAVKIPHSFGFLQGREFVPIILSAIERATREQREQSNHTQRLIGLTKLSKAAHEAAQPQRSEQQEWTPLECVGSGWQIKGSGMGWGFSEGQAKAICDAHNATLTVERQRREQAEQQILNREQRWEEMQSQLTAECKLSEQADKDYVELKRGMWQRLNEETERRKKNEQQLLSALAAIEKAKEVMCLMHEATLQASGTKKESELGRKSYFAFKEFIDKSVDLSPLRAHDIKLIEDQMQRDEAYWKNRHDAEVRRPLVDALIKLSKLSTQPIDERDKLNWTGKLFCSAVKDICDDALSNENNKQPSVTRHLLRSRVVIR